MSFEDNGGDSQPISGHPSAVSSVSSSLRAAMSGNPLPFNIIARLFSAPESNGAESPSAAPTRKYN